MDYVPQIGDIILEDSNKTAAKIVKFFMTAPTWYQYLWRAIIRKQDIVNYYHVAMIINNGFSGFTGKTDIIEQQTKVELADWNPKTHQIIFRKRNLTSEQLQTLKTIALEDIGRGYDVLNILGKTLTWLTGIQLFGRYLEWPRAEICINRVAYWYKEVLCVTFGTKTHTELTTHLLYLYLLQSSEYMLVYKK